ncbi:colicin E3/pyocin S6 family cytotoxin [Salinarimonas chemoclinalis]|uniref:colicin E3/pyocin S6 family cytotoxin n=1 Tax=Salinarimonas chemoclinalis TaxID=3241599 RepID=UPI003557B1B0
MSPKTPPPKLPAFPSARRVRAKTRFGRTRERARWRDDWRIYGWDYQHGRVEVYDLRGRHLGEFDSVTGEMTKPGNPARRIEP